MVGSIEKVLGRARFDADLMEMQADVCGLALSVASVNK